MTRIHISWELEHDILSLFQGVFINVTIVPAIMIIIMIIMIIVVIIIVTIDLSNLTIIVRG